MENKIFKEKKKSYITPTKQNARIYTQGLVDKRNHWNRTTELEFLTSAFQGATDATCSRNVKVLKLEDVHMRILLLLMGSTLHT